MIKILNKNCAEEDRNPPGPKRNEKQQLFTIIIYNRIKVLLILVHILTALHTHTGVFSYSV